MKNAPYPLNPTNYTPNNFNHLLSYLLKEYPNKDAFRFREKRKIKSVTYPEFVFHAHNLGKYFLSKNFKNAKIAVIGENSYFWLLTYYGAVSSGNIIVPIDNQLTSEDVLQTLKRSDASVFVYSDDYSDIIQDIKGEAPEDLIYINMKKDMPKLIDYDGKVKIDESYFSDVKIAKDDVAAIVYTSGTTGLPKGVMLSHMNILSDAASGCRYVDIALEETLLILPLYHTLSTTPGVLAQLIGGTTVSICAGLKNVSRDLADFKPTYTIMVPLMIEAMYKKIWETAKADGKDKLLKTMLKISDFLLKIGIDLRRKLFKSVINAFGGNLEWILSGGAPLSVEYVYKFRSFGIEVLQAYGVTECSPGVSLNRNRHFCDGSVGLVIDCNEVKIKDKDEKGIGEIYVKGTNVMLGYYKDEIATKEAFDGEWLKTGDLGYLNSDGFLFITGRKKNLIVLSNGKNVSPEELEQKIQSIPYVLEVIVYQEEDKIIAEAFLDTDNYPDCKDSIDADIRSLNKTLPQYKYIAKTVVRDEEFPKTTTKKIIR